VLSFYLFFRSQWDFCYRLPEDRVNVISSSVVGRHWCVRVDLLFLENV